MGPEQFAAFLPYDNFEVETPYTLEEVQECIQALIERRAAFDIKTSAKDILRAPRSQSSPVPFSGKVEGTRFHIVPQLGQRNSPHPQFKGMITPTPYGSTVHVKICLPRILLIMWVITVIFLLLYLPGLLHGQLTYIAAQAAFTVGLYIVTMAHYNEQAIPAKKALLQILAPQNETPIEP